MAERNNRGMELINWRARDRIDYHVGLIYRSRTHGTRPSGNEKFGLRRGDRRVLIVTRWVVAGLIEQSRL